MTIGRNHRYTPKTKHELVVLIDWLGQQGYSEATQKIMGRLGLTPEELGLWRQQLEKAGRNGLKVTRAPRRQKAA